MRSGYMKVEGSPHLLKDPHSKVVINNDESGYRSYIALREANERKRSEAQTMRQEIDEIKNDVSEIKSLLLQLLEKK